MISKSTLKVEFRSVFRCQNVEACEMLVDVLKVICHSNEIYVSSFTDDVYQSKQR